MLRREESIEGLVRGGRLLRTDQKNEDGRSAGNVRRKLIEENI